MCRHAHSLLFCTCAHCVVSTDSRFHIIKLSLLLFREQIACFQLVMASDYRTGRSYVMFNYNNIGWWEYRLTAQGYYGPWATPVVMFTSFNFLSYSLPWLIGNTGKDNYRMETVSLTKNIKIRLNIHQILTHIFVQVISCLHARQTCITDTSLPQVFCLSVCYTLILCRNGCFLQHRAYGRVLILAS